MDSPRSDTPTTAPSLEKPPCERTPRLMSLDALRGFDMFWIIGADALVASLAKVSPIGILGVFAHQLSHAEWEGFRFYDLIFPLFLFMVGISTVFSLEHTVTKEGKKAAYYRIFRRFAFLWFWAFIYSGGFAQEKISFAGVLQRISYCYLITSLLYLNFNLRGLVVVCVSILVGYWALMTFVPVPELGRPLTCIPTGPIISIGIICPVIGRRRVGAMKGCSVPYPPSQPACWAFSRAC